MKKCVLYYNRGEKCTIRLIVSIASLRKYWTGDIVLAHDGPQSKYLVDRLNQFNVKYVLTEPSSVSNPLADKPTLNRYVRDYDLVLYVDSDTLFCNPFDEIWSFAQQYGFVVTHFSNWKTTGGMIEKRIREWSKVMSEEDIEASVAYGKAVNTGVFAFSTEYTFSKNNIFLEWHDLTLKGQENDCTRRMVDELACQNLLPKYPHIMLNINWNMSAKFGKMYEGTRIIHYHGYKHVFVDEFPLCKLWQDQYLELVKAKIISTDDIYGDRRLRDAPWRKAIEWKQ
jgi:hypothetical protein